MSPSRILSACIRGPWVAALFTALFAATPTAQAQVPSDASAPPAAAPDAPVAPVPPPSVPTAPPAAPYFPMAPTAAPYFPMAPTAAPPPTGLDTLPPRTDSALAVGIVDVSIAGTLVALGLLINDTEARTAFLGGAVGTAAVGVPMIAAGAGRVRYARRSEGAFVVGSVLASVGGTITGFSVGAFGGAHLARNEEEALYGSSFTAPAPAGAVFGTTIGAVLAGAGAGLMVFGALEKSPEDQEADAAKRAERRRIAERARSAGGEVTAPRSVPRRTAGQVLTVIGGLSGAGAVATGVHFSNCSGDFCGFGHLLTTFPLAINGVICTAVGIPLWVSGAAEVPIDQLAQNETWVPEVAIGAGTATLTMRF